MVYDVWSRWHDLPPLADLSGEYNDHGVVDAAEDIVWRENGGTGAALPNDTIGGMIGQGPLRSMEGKFLRGRWSKIGRRHDRCARTISQHRHGAFACLEWFVAFFKREVAMRSRESMSRCVPFGFLLLAALAMSAPPAAVGQRVILSEDFESDTPNSRPASADFYAKGCTPFVNCGTDPATIVVTGGQFPDPFGPGNQSLAFHNPNSAAQARITWTFVFEDDPSTFRNGTVEFDLWMEKPLPLLGEPGGKFWSFIDVRTGYGGPERNQVTTVDDVTVWPNFRIQNIFGQPQPRDQVVDAGGRFSLGFETAYTDGAADIWGPDESFHVELEINGGNGTPGTEYYVIKINDTPITWPQNGEASSPWVPDAPGINILSFLTDASAFFSGGATNAYLDNLVVINNDLPPLADLFGDYNDNGVVDAADYVLWRNGGPLQNEVDTPGTVNAADYTEWRARFGNSLGPGSAAGVPEPASWVMLLLVFTLANWGVRQRCCTV